MIIQIPMDTMNVYCKFPNQNSCIISSKNTNDTITMLFNYKTFSVFLIIHFIVQIDKNS